MCSNYWTSSIVLFSKGNNEREVGIIRIDPDWKVILTSDSFGSKGSDWLRLDFGLDRRSRIELDWFLIDLHQTRLKTFLDWPGWIRISSDIDFGMNFIPELFLEQIRHLIDYYMLVTFLNAACRKSLGLFVKIIPQNR